MGLRLGFVGLCLSALAFGAPCEVSFDGKQLALDTVIKSDGDLTDVYSLLDQFDTSKEIARSVRRYVERKELVIETFARLLPGQSIVDNPAALFDRSRARPTIYLDNAELGVLSAVYFHEMFHAADETYAQRYPRWQAAYKKLSDEYASLPYPSPAYDQWVSRGNQIARDRDRMIFEAERPAFDAQFNLIGEIGEKFACAKKYYAERGRKEMLVVHRASDEQIIQHYKLNPEYVRRPLTK